MIDIYLLKVLCSVVSLLIHMNIVSCSNENKLQNISIGLSIFLNYAKLPSL